MSPITPTPITLLDGVERHLVFTLAASKRIKERLGASLLEGGVTFQSIDEDKLAVLLVCGLAENDQRLCERIGLQYAPLTEEDVATLMSVGQLPALLAALQQAINLSFGPADPPPPAETVN